MQETTLGLTNNKYIVHDSCATRRNGDSTMGPDFPGITVPAFHFSKPINSQRQLNAIPKYIRDAKYDVIPDLIRDPSSGERLWFNT